MLRQHHRPLHFAAAEIEKAILQPQVFARQVALAGSERRRLAGVQDFEVFAADFDFAGGQLVIGFSFQPIGDFAADQDHAFGRNTAGLVDQLRIGFGRPDRRLG